MFRAVKNLVFTYYLALFCPVQRADCKHFESAFQIRSRCDQRSRVNLHTFIFGLGKEISPVAQFINSCCGYSKLHSLWYSPQVVERRSTITNMPTTRSGTSHDFPRKTLFSSKCRNLVQRKFCKEGILIRWARDQRSPGRQRIANAPALR